MKQRFIALICIATLVFCGCGGKKQSSVQTDSGSEQPDATEESTEQSRNDPVTITFNSKTETYHADDLSTVLLYTSYQKPMVTIDGHPKISKTITQSLNEELDAFQDARLESLLSARISFAESPDSFSAYHLDEDFPVPDRTAGLSLLRVPEKNLPVRRPTVLLMVGLIMIWKMAKHFLFLILLQIPMP